MKKISLICVVPLLLGGCATTILDDCNGFAKTVTITYGDSGIDYTPKKKVKQQKPFVIKLNPKPKKDWKDKNVIITGKSRKPSSCPNESWLDTQDTYEVRKKFKYCAPALPEAVPEDEVCEYKYSVEVKDGGARLLFADPRVDVEH